jgi:hypothetical protein
MANHALDLGIIQVNAVVGNDVRPENAEGFHMLKWFFPVFRLDFGDLG